MSGTGLRLRRDVRGFLAGFFGELLFLPLVPVGLLSGPTPAGVTVAVGVSALLGFAYVPSEIVLGEEVLNAGHRLANKRPYRLIADRGCVVRASHGKVSWWRGMQVDGIEILLSSGTVVPLPLSTLLGERRRSEWVSEINRWARASSFDSR